MRDAAQSLEEGLVARLRIDGADEAAVNLQIVEADMVQAADFAELAAEMFDSEAAAERSHRIAEGVELGEMLEDANFRNLKPEAGSKLAPAADQGLQAAAESGVQNRLAGEVDRNRRRTGGNAVQGQAGGGQIEFGGHRQARSHRHEAAGSQPFTIFAGLQAERAFEVEQLAPIAGDWKVDQAQALGFDGPFEQLFPVGVGGGVLFATRFCPAPGQAALIFGRGQGGIDLREQVADPLTMPIEAAGQMADAFAVDQAGRAQVAQQAEQLLGRCRRILNPGQQQGKIGAIESGGGSARLAGGKLGEFAPDTAQQLVGGFAAGALVDAGQVSHAQHQQGAVAGGIVIAQGGLQLVEEKGTVGQAGQVVERRFPAHLFETRRLFGKHRLQSLDHRVHRAGQALQLRCRGFGNADETPLADRLGLADDGVEWSPDIAQQLHAKQAHEAAADQKPGDQLEAAVPEFLIGKLAVANQLDRAKLVPAGADLGQAGLRGDRKEANEPGRDIAGHWRAGLFDHRLAFRIDQPHRRVLTAVEHCSHLQFNGDRILLQLRHREGERRGVVAVLDGQLMLEIMAGSQHAGEKTAGESDQRARNDGEPELAE